MTLLHLGRALSAYVRDDQRDLDANVASARAYERQMRTYQSGHVNSFVADIKYRRGDRSQKTDRALIGCDRDDEHGCSDALARAKHGDATALIAGIDRKSYWLPDADLFDLAPSVTTAKDALGRIWRWQEMRRRSVADDLMWRAVYDRDFFRSIGDSDGAARSQAIAMRHYGVFSDPSKATAILGMYQVEERLFMLVGYEP